MLSTENINNCTKCARRSLLNTPKYLSAEHCPEKAHYANRHDQNPFPSPNFVFVHEYPPLIFKQQYVLSHGLPPHVPASASGAKSRVIARAVVLTNAAVAKALRLPTIPLHGEGNRILSAWQRTSNGFSLGFTSFHRITPFGQLPTEEFFNRLSRYRKAEMQSF